MGLRAGRRLWLFRVGAVLVGITPLLLAELGLRALGLGKATDQGDPFVGFSAVWPLFVRSADGSSFEIPPSRRLCFEAQSFPAVKPAREFRIFCLGGSTVQGHPFSVPTSFTTWLELSLDAADPRHDWRVVNCGGVSYASYRLLPILEEVLAYQPDLVLLYIGDNEFLEDRTYEPIKRQPPLVRTAQELAVRSRLYNLARAGVGTLLGERQRPEVRTILPAEVDALLDYQGGLQAYHRDDAWRAGVLAHYEANLRRMVVLCQERNVPVILVSPVCNLETPPFKSEHRPGLTADELARFEAAWKTARGLYRKNLPRAVRHLQQAAAIDGEHAGLLFALGEALLDLGRFAEARAALSQARDWDVCPLRILSAMQRIVHEVGNERGVPVLDAFELFSRQNPAGIPGDDWLVDHVHPSIRGYQLLAGALFELMVDAGLVRPAAGWEPQRDRRYAEHLASLDDFYYMLAEKRLQNLETWARGRTTRLRSEGPIGESFRRRHGAGLVRDTDG